MLVFLYLALVSNCCFRFASTSTAWLGTRCLLSCLWCIDAVARLCRGKWVALDLRAVVWHEARLRCELFAYAESMCAIIGLTIRFCGRLGDWDGWTHALREEPACVWQIHAL